ncbi:MAG: Rpn family recombination-promoting nuclease/putative transposase [Spirochaetes bacterium]|nr:Rpn family recombination-promoting nuclease/putative transposase [Spirochaetota bacterium]
MSDIATKRESDSLLSPKIDFVFKIIFGDPKNVGILTGLLEPVLSLPAEEYEEVIIVDPHLLREREDDKLGVLDVKVKTKSRITIDVELQMQPKSDFAKRASFYQAKMITEQMSKGSDYSDIQKVVSIIITDYKLFPDNGNYHSRFTMYDPDTKREFSEVQEIHILELPKLPEKDDGTELWAWTKFFTLIDKKEFEMLAETHPKTKIKQAVAILEELSEDQRARMLLESRQIYEVDKRMERDFARREGRAEGKAEGRAEGKAEAEKAIARKALAAGIPLETIHGLTGLDIETIKSL